MDGKDGKGERGSGEGRMERMRGAGGDGREEARAKGAISGEGRGGEGKRGRR